MKLIKGIPSDLKKFDKYFSGTTIFAFFNLLLSSASVAFHASVAFTRVTHLVNGSQFLNETSVSAGAAATFISPVTRIYAFE